MGFKNVGASAFTIHLSLPDGFEGHWDEFVDGENILKYIIISFLQCQREGSGVPG